MADERDRAASPVEPQVLPGDELEDALVLEAPEPRRPPKTEVDRAQGLKTRTAFKDIVSRRM